MSSAVEQIKAKLGIVEVVSNYLKLERAGANYKARCPFHNEKTASFFVSPTRQTYHCFGCNRGGDIINFVEEVEGLDFLGALKLLAERAGVQLESSGARVDNSEKTLLYRLLEYARDYYVDELASNPLARDYLISRGLKPDTIHNFQIGFAPTGWQNLQEQLHSKHYSDALIIKAGLAIRSPKTGGLYDRFRSRIIFPLNDASGRVVGFSGRIFGEAVDGSPAGGGKYINSPETELYHKGKILYGFDRAKSAIRSAGLAVIVEGHLDLILAHQAGTENAVAVSGTALTTEHLALLKRLTNDLIIAFDGDAAGVNAAKRSIALALENGMNVKLLDLPDQTDPADLIQRDPKLWQQALESALPAIDFLLNRLSREEGEKLALIHRIEEEIYPYLARLPNAHDRDHYLAKIALLTQLSENSIREKLRTLPTAEARPTSPIAPTQAPTQASKQERIREQLCGLAWWRGDTESVAEVCAPLEARRNELTLAAELAYAGMNQVKLGQEALELHQNWQLEVWQEEVQDWRFRLGRAEYDGEEAVIEECLQQLNVLYKNISDFKNKKIK